MLAKCFGGEISRKKEIKFVSYASECECCQDGAGEELKLDNKTCEGLIFVIPSRKC